ncbi:MAG: hypothetical protein ABI675_25760 [Chitinophagaceae bacterium]
MHLYKPSLQGTYKPTLFALSINKNKVLNGQNQLKDEYGNIFFHEYIHYLQDILTSFGLQNICSLARKFSVVNHEILGSALSDFAIPYVSTNKSLQLDEERFELIEGTFMLLDNSRNFEVINIELDPYLLNPELADQSYINVNILYRDNSETDAFYLGAFHFLENMAHILERNFSIEDRVPPFPYKVIEKITKSAFPYGDFSDINFIRIIEMALESHDPANYYFTFYRFCMDHDLAFTKETIELYKNINALNWGREKYDYNNFYYPNATMARKAFDAMFIHDNLKPLKEWGRLLISNGIKIRRSGFSFNDLLVVNGDYDRVKKKTGWLIKRLGTPIMTDNGFGVFLSSPDGKISEDSMIYLLGLEAVLNILNGDTACSIFPYCSNGQGGPIVTNASCKTAPWDRTKITPLCLLAQMWIMWGFVKKNCHV